MELLSSNRHRKRNPQTVYFNVVSWVPVITSFLFLLPQLYPTFHLLFRSAARSLSDPYPTSFRTKQDGDSGIIGVGEWSGGPGGLIILGSRGHSVTATLMLARRLLEKVEVENVARYSSAALSLRLIVAAELLLPARLLYRELLSIRWPCAHVLIGHATMTSLRETKSNHAKCKVLL